MRTQTREDKLLAEYPSSSDPDITYGILLGNDGKVYCECVGWKMRKDCKHLRDFEGGCHER